MSEILESNRDHLRVEAIDRPDGSWDVVIIIDGGYSGETWVTKKEMIDYFRRWLSDELGVPVRGPRPASRAK